LLDVAQKAMDLNFDGIMTEVHPTPDDAWSDAAQQITPAQFKELTDKLMVRKPTYDESFMDQLEHLRHQIDEIDDDLLNLLEARMKLSESIGEYKKDNNIAILQPERWGEILDRSVAKGTAKGLTKDFVYDVFKAIHKESINKQAKLLRDETVKEE
jgi:chorismate mutase